MRWLQWSDKDLEKGLGGVEVHAQSLHRELRALGVDSRISSNPKILAGHGWDVIQTHGSSPLPFKMNKALQLTETRNSQNTDLTQTPRSLVNSKQSRPIRVHTLHGSTLGRMSACHEWLWPGGYAAYGREWVGVLQSDAVLGVHPSIHLLSLARALGKKTAVCWNGWDSGEALDGALPAELRTRLEHLRPSFCYVGRGDDVVKNTAFLAAVFKQLPPSAHLIAIPGDGFPSNAQIFHAGRLNPAQVLAVLRMSRSLLLCSHYEGLPLVVLEALGNATPVYSTRVGGLRHLSTQLQGLHFLKPDLDLWKDALLAALQGECPGPTTDAASIAAQNRTYLPSWKQVAKTALTAVEEVKHKLSL